MTTQKRITKRLVGRLVVFSGYDGNKYSAIVDRVASATAKLRYQVSIQGRIQWITAYISDASRIAA